MAHVYCVTKPGTLGDSSSTRRLKMARVRAAGVQYCTVPIGWDGLQSSAGGAVSTASMQAFLDDAAAQDLKVVVEIALHYPPSFVTAVVERFKKQDAAMWTGTHLNGDDIVDWQWTAQGRTYVADLFTKLGTSGIASHSALAGARMGGGYSGEAHYAPITTTSGLPNEWWIFGTALQTGTGIASDQVVCPHPGRTPLFNGSNDAFDLDISDWWLNGMSTWITWLVAQHKAAGFGGTGQELWVLHPSTGVRNRPYTDAGYIQEVARGVDPHRLMAAYASDSKVWPWSTWNNNTGTGIADKDQGSCVKLLQEARAFNKLTKFASENTGGESNSTGASTSMDGCFTVHTGQSADNPTGAEGWLFNWLQYDDLVVNDPNFGGSGSGKATLTYYSSKIAVTDPAALGRTTVVAKAFPRHLPSLGFGFTPATDNTQLHLTLDRMVADGATWIRYDVSWAGYSPTARNTYDATYQGAIDLAVNEAYARGVNVCLQVSNTPAWAAVSGASTTIAPVLNPSDFQSFVNYVVTRYKGKIQAIMGWDKPAYAAYFSGTVAQMVATQQALFAGAKAADVNIKVASPATDGVDAAWWNSFYAAGGKSTFDVAAVSPYNVPSDDPPEATGTSAGNPYGPTAYGGEYVQSSSSDVYKLQSIPNLRSILDANGDTSKKIWLAQFGWSAHTNTGSEANYQRGVTNFVQSVYFARAFEYIRRLSYVENAFWTRLVDYAPTTDPGQIQAANRGLIEMDYTTKEALRALQVYGFVQPERLLKRWDFRTGPGEWFLVTSTPGSAAYPTVNNEKELYTPTAWTFDSTGAHCQAYKTGTQWFSGKMDLRRILDFVGSCRIRFRWRGPRVQGAWPSCYLMPRPVVAPPNQTGRYGPWPSSGEMDAMEAGHSTHPGMISGTVHLDDPLGSGFTAGHIQLPAVGTNFKTCDWSQYHIVTFDWLLNSNTITFKWYLDDVLWQTVTNAPHQPFPFEQPFYPILNMAWGGDFPGDPDGTTPLSGNFMDIDWFEVYSLGGTLSSVNEVDYVVPLPPRNATSGTRGRLAVWASVGKRFDSYGDIYTDRY